MDELVLIEAALSEFNDNPEFIRETVYNTFLELEYEAVTARITANTVYNALLMVGKRELDPDPRLRSAE